MTRAGPAHVRPDVPGAALFRTGRVTGEHLRRIRALVPAAADWPRWVGLPTAGSVPSEVRHLRRRLLAHGCELRRPLDPPDQITRFPALITAVESSNTQVRLLISVPRSMVPRKSPLDRRDEQVLDSLLGGGSERRIRWVPCEYLARPGTRSPSGGWMSGPHRENLLTRPRN